MDLHKVGTAQLKADIDRILASPHASKSDLRMALQLAEALERSYRENSLESYSPYPYQQKFHNDRANERLLMAANQIGKTWCSAAECAIHATGLYPEWWQGHRFDTANNGWVGSETAEGSVDTMQRLMLGRIGQLGTGAIPKSKIVEVMAARNVPGAVALVLVRHAGGGISQVRFKTYEQGREKWQGETLHWVALDEEPPPDIYAEAVTRTNATRGIVWITFTPLKGPTKVVNRFLKEKPPNTSVIRATIDDALHYSPEERARVVARYLPHERDARSKGIPIMGSGMVFPVSEEKIKVEPFRIPNHWPRIIGHDFGWDHPAGTACLAWDRDTDIVYVYDAWKVREQSAALNALELKVKSGGWIPVAWPHDGLQHDKGSGEQLADQYRNHGAPMHFARSTFPDTQGPMGEVVKGGNSLEAGIAMMLERMQTGRLRVFSHLNDWFEEFRGYHRVDGRIVAIDEDILSATRYALMMLRIAKTQEEAQPDGFNAAQNATPSFGVLDPMIGY